MLTMEKGDVLGHKPMGEVVEVGRQVQKLKKGDSLPEAMTGAHLENSERMGR
jgi:D-arabinose 1-dehydrogenase-like Zn-dependent alcohol dehydrogenase